MKTKLLFLFICLGSIGSAYGMDKDKTPHEKILELMKNFIASTENINVLGSDGERSPLMFAADNNYEDIVKLLLDNGANPNLQNNDGITALMITIAHGNQDIAKLLLDNGANPNIYSDNNDTALTIAIRFNHEPIVKLLLENGANPDYQDESGITHLMWTVRKGSKPVVKLLLDHGADFDVKINKHGQTALDIAKEKEDKSIIELIENEYEKRRQLVHKEVVENSCLPQDLAGIVSEYVVYPKKEKTK